MFTGRVTNEVGGDLEGVILFWRLVMEESAVLEFLPITGRLVLCLIVLLKSFLLFPLSALLKGIWWLEILKLPPILDLLKPCRIILRRLRFDWATHHSEPGQRS